MKITFIGAGNMAEAIVAGIIKQNVVEAADVCVTDINEERLDHFTEQYGVGRTTDNAAAVAQADVIVLSVKPQIFPDVWPEIERALKSDALVISIMAGIPSAKIANGKPIRVVRVMPNTPALVGEGAAGIAAGEFAVEADVEIACNLLGAVGVAVVVDEKEIDAVTALSGSGPAYVFYLLESMLEAAEQMGLEKGVSRELALSTVIGAAKLMRESGEEAAGLRAKVTSKGGTTHAAISTLEEHGVKDAVVAALKAAQTRSIELANG
ncbi:pyrroline-5-carboxylate reductase [Pontiella agarivorans]|uniref:Pyrroline-5-carboxylate reductase n=1 Tax=Pontiella agarivorans TaxID=3038953 RepID=A0ABU5MWE8_9BACT|nr:pyrroline-5-carboxylate reductase [Pontiella agarivorans]MDZ8118477.1 pyrroline-5-carboxylate reductase [Pontiella agarivorans]